MQSPAKTVVGYPGLVALSDRVAEYFRNLHTSAANDHDTVYCLKFYVLSCAYHRWSRFVEIVDHENARDRTDAEYVYALIKSIAEEFERNVTAAGDQDQVSRGRPDELGPASTLLDCYRILAQQRWSAETSLPKSHWVPKNSYSIRHLVASVKHYVTDLVYELAIAEDGQRRIAASDLTELLPVGSSSKRDRLEEILEATQDVDHIMMRVVGNALEREARPVPTMNFGNAHNTGGLQIRENLLNASISGDAHLKFGSHSRGANSFNDYRSGVIGAIGASSSSSERRDPFKSFLGKLPASTSSSGEGIKLPEPKATERNIVPGVLESLIRRLASKNADTVKWTMPWQQIRACVDDDLDGSTTLEDFLTISGTPSAAYATTCGDWIQKTWSDLGMSVLAATRDMLLGGTFASKQLKMRLVETRDTEELLVSAEYTDIGETVVVAETLAWIMATFRPPLGDCLAYSTLVASSTDETLRVSLKPLVKVKQNVSNSCWHPLVGNSVIAGGFCEPDDELGPPRLRPSSFPLDPSTIKEARAHTAAQEAAQGPEKSEKGDTRWTEITKDLVDKKAIEKMAWQYQETGEHFYILQCLRDEEVSQLVELTEKLRSERDQSRSGPAFPALSGLGLPFQLMLELTGMMYGTDLSKSLHVDAEAESPQDAQLLSNEVCTDEESTASNKFPVLDTQVGMFYTGVHSILYPTERDNTRKVIKWHYASSDCVMTPQNDGTWLRLHDADLLGMDTVLGYTPEVSVLLGTPDRVQQYNNMRTSSAAKEKNTWTFSWDGVTMSAGFAGSGMAFPFKFNRRKGQQIAPSATPNYDQIVQYTADKPLILFDTARQQETAWLVSQLSVILDIALLKSQRHGWWQALDQTARAALHARPHWNGGLAAQEVLDNYERANTILRFSADDGTVLAIKDLIKEIYAAMTVRTQLDQLYPSMATLSTPPLIGWDLLELTDPILQSKRLSVDVHKSGGNNSTPTWLHLAREVPVLFCDGLGSIMTSRVPVCSVFQCNQKYLVASLHALRSKMTHCSSCRGYHIGNDRQWVWQAPPDGYFVPCMHGNHSVEVAKARFDESIQLILRANHQCVVLNAEEGLKEGAVVFGPKRLFVRSTDRAHGEYMVTAGR